MAGDWIKIEIVTPDKPEIIRMAGLLKMDQDAVFGKCFRVWAWADQHTITGHALTVTETFLDRLTNCPGFANALRQAGWLEGRDAALVFPNFARHNGQTAKSRALANDRKKKEREMSRECHDESVTETRPEKRREEKSKEEEKNKKEEIEIPEPLNLPTFRTVFAEWQAFRRKMKACKDWNTLWKKQLEIMAEWGADVAIIAMNRSMANGWQGLFDPREGHPRGQTATGAQGGISGPAINTVHQAEFVIAECGRQIEELKVYVSDDGPPRKIIPPGNMDQYRRLTAKIKEARKKITECKS